LQPTAKSIPKPTNAKPHYEPAQRQNTAKRVVPVDTKPPKKSTVAPGSIIQGSELEQLRQYNKKMKEERDSQDAAKNYQVMPTSTPPTYKSVESQPIVVRYEEKDGKCCLDK